MSNWADEALAWSFNVPNGVTILRAVLTVPIAWLVYQGGAVEVVLAGILLMIAWGTDGLDGFLARRLGQSSLAGALLDLVADRLIMTPAVILSIVGGYWARTAGMMPFTPYPYAAVVLFADLTVLVGVATFLWKRRTRAMPFPPPTQLARIAYSVQMPTLVVGVLGIGPDWLLAGLMYLTIIITVAAFYSYMGKASYVFTD
jgi:phosphatidylglycerophosphate synthase